MAQAPELSGRCCANLPVALQTPTTYRGVPYHPFRDGMTASKTQHSSRYRPPPTNSCHPLRADRNDGRSSALPLRGREVQRPTLSYKHIRSKGRHSSQLGAETSETQARWAAHLVQPPSRVRLFLEIQLILATMRFRNED